MRIRRRRLSLGHAPQKRERDPGRGRGPTGMAHYWSQLLPVSNDLPRAGAVRAIEPRRISPRWERLVSGRCARRSSAR